MSEIDNLYAAVLGLKAPWRVERVETQLDAGEVHVTVALPKNTRWVCPECGAAAPIHDHQERSWGHLDTCQFHTIVHARVPRLNCPTHGVRQLKVPWAEPGSQFTAMFEALAIDWLSQASVSAVSKHLRISWDEASGIMERAVRRGLEHREAEVVKQVGEGLERLLQLDPLHAALRHSRGDRGLLERLPCGSQYLHALSAHGSDHPPSPPGGGAVHPRSRRAAGYRSYPRSGGQSFRNRGGQNFRNPHQTLIRAVVSAAMAIALCGLLAGSVAFADEPTDFAEYLAGRDLVVEGTVTAVDTIFRARLGGCGLTGLSATKSWDIHIRVSRVVLGTAEDSSIVLTTLGRSQFPGQGLRVGARVIAWASRNCSDAWRLWGNVALISNSGQLIPDHNNVGSFRLEGHPRGLPVRLSAVDSSLVERTPLSSVRAFDGAAAVALLRVTSVLPGTERAYSLACDSVEVVLGAITRAPRFVDMSPLEGCTRTVSVGDSIIVPLASDFAAERLSWRGCSGQLLVKERFAAGFGVPLGFLSYALRREGDELRVRPFIAREE